MQPAISFENVSKRFFMTSERPQTVLETIIALTKGQRMRGRERELWAVDDLSFELMPGECLGIIGRNGSGKSTVLKMIARILRPTRGRITVRGRISALLELGAGFHPDLTGRENIYLNASVLGLNREEVDRRFQSIVDFSELASFIDVPVKHYSSGMHVRLGFSVAIHVEPDILILDEILAVGDQAFQTKCIDQIYALKRDGTTIILISHNMEVVRSLCTKLLWLEQGALRDAGSVGRISTEYLAETYTSQQQLERHSSTPFKRWGSGEIEIESVRLLNEEGREFGVFRTSETMSIEVHYVAKEPVDGPRFDLAVHRQDGIQVIGPNSRTDGLEVGLVDGAGCIIYRVESLPLLPGRYQVTVTVRDGDSPTVYDHHEQAYPFRVIADDLHDTQGVVTIPATWTWQPQEKHESEKEAATTTLFTR
ncbi:MAG TPA: ABC transporter ATP-binding protein [Candidatus Binatia bacterium]|nr:ABC transporter ATP-binding protein [Candidatus Binatia bacterium]